ncbi:MAG: tripartite tricarboxylate transporter substrate binding protein [Xanthobacteraceae bacterium]|nr:tripartite tricarboxylate transporter substrate binding protein [Xanthobacteraceae bacterium]
MNARRVGSLVAASFLIAFLAGSAALAQTFPSTVIRLVVPFAAGGQPDAVARLIAPSLSRTIGTTIVENKPGAGTLLATRSVATAEPDGHTLLFATSTPLTIAPNLVRSPGYDPIKDFVPIATVATAPFILAVGPSVKANTLGEFIAYAKANPGKINYAAPTRNLPHLTGEWFKLASGADMVAVPYKSLAQAYTDLIAGQIDVVFDTSAILAPLILQGKVRGLVVFASNRTVDLPEVPAAPEAGLQQVLVSSWLGVVAPARTPAGTVERLSRAVTNAVTSDEVKTALTKLGAQPLSLTRQKFGEMIATDLETWGRTIREAGIAVE